MGREQLKTFVKESHIPGMGGWGNGYVIIPKEHPMHNKHYDEINNHVDVHYGLTFSETVDEDIKQNWPELSDANLGDTVVGFDTLHYGDDEFKWPYEAVVAETERLKTQLEELA